ncbi:head-to-tail adaptor [Mycobacterium phage Bonamassa]|uniref:Head-to-tail adaptor n=5 Tax=Caudoviricetes TaxID=2731619 RepID=A0A0N9SIH8_9CAUD|nr:head-tail adaptor Ad1 [Mycobacterium phage LittleCherry]YP_009208899.1 head-tail adaptor Ad1 [Mycobacterium phage Swirley]YP_009214285.1 head-tail adaptor Ad1 [Mycobacterium phage Theia]YP_009635775.1 head-tail adaptor Ad1 [Mycobacterium phage George]YP_009638101.1 head-tail adaptor Ad1 [Mycobacterium phage Cuco]AVR76600.1 head-to-tail adaptor [Mycobacterium phage Coog]AVR77145.1 head-to-tail adaptor [Mycobacterium phage Midas2]AXC33836.1 head-to-tail adaptor [Mycobacterium phage Tarynear
MAQATATDVTVFWARTPTTEEVALIDRRLEQAERLLKKSIPDLDDRCAADPIFKADVIDIEAEAVLRLVRNHEGYISETDGNYTYMLQAQDPNRKLEILPEEWELLGIKRTRMAILVPDVVMPS